MEAKELQLGDWVQSKAYNGEYLYTRIEVLDSRGKKKHIISSNRWIEEDEFEPIPLTLEILEKNGFERRGGISYHKSIAGLIIVHWNDELCFLNSSKKSIPSIIIPFHYVHELQRALRCCGLSELADNFKV